MKRWTTESVLSLAPDARAAAAARKLANPGPWSDLGATEVLVFGSCQGSGRVPYQVAVDLGEPAFRCTCPSRKLPCKHGLALLLLWADGGGSVADVGTPADHANEWSTARLERSARVAAKVADGAPDAGPVDPEAQARRLEARVERMTQGLADLELWLTDVVRNGLAAARAQPVSFWDTAAERLVDAQVPALAARVRNLASIAVGGDEWADRMLEELSRCWLATRAWSRRHSLPPAVLADLRVVLGWSVRTEEVAAGDRLVGDWQVLGVGSDDLDSVTAQRTWLHDTRSATTVHLLHFAAGGPLPVPPVVGSVIRAELALYPGSDPRRAMFTGDRAVVATAPGLAMGTQIDDGLLGVARNMAANPWADHLPMALSDVRIVRRNGRPAATDRGGRALRIDPRVDVGTVLAVAGGQPCDLFGEWNGHELRPLAAMVAGEVVVA